MKLEQFEMSTFKVGEVLKVGQAIVKENTTNAIILAKCGSAYNCSGGGGQCGSAYNCSGGGGKCGSAYNCSGT